MFRLSISSMAFMGAQRLMWCHPMNAVQLTAEPSRPKQLAYY